MAALQVIILCLPQHMVAQVRVVIANTCLTGGAGPKSPTSEDAELAMRDPGLSSMWHRVPLWGCLALSTPSQGLHRVLKSSTKSNMWSLKQEPSPTTQEPQMRVMSKEQKHLAAQRTLQ